MSGSEKNEKSSQGMPKCHAPVCNSSYGNRLSSIILVPRRRGENSMPMFACSSLRCEQNKLFLVPLETSISQDSRTQRGGGTRIENLLEHWWCVGRLRLLLGNYSKESEENQGFSIFYQSEVQVQSMSARNKQKPDSRSLQVNLHQNLLK